MSDSRGISRHIVGPALQNTTRKQRPAPSQPTPPPPGDPVHIRMAGTPSFVQSFVRSFIHSSDRVTGCLPCARTLPGRGNDPALALGVGVGVEEGNDKVGSKRGIWSMRR